MSVGKLIGCIKKVNECIGTHTIREGTVLIYLMSTEEKVVHYQTIIKDLDLSPVAITRCLKYLIDQGAVTMCMDNEDTRKKSVALTDKGKALKLDLIQILEDTNERKSKSQ